MPYFPNHKLQGCATLQDALVLLCREANVEFVCLEYRQAPYEIRVRYKDATGEHSVDCAGPSKFDTALAFEDALKALRGKT